MANRAKDKGDRGEREAVDYLTKICPDLLRVNASRLLGAGRAEDVGDLYAIAGVTIQVKNFGPKSLSSAMYSSATGAVEQAKNARNEFAFGLVRMHNARKGTNRWIVSAIDWPVPLDAEPVKHTAATAAANWAKQLTDPESAVAVVERAGSPRLYVAPLEGWIAAYRAAREENPAQLEWSPA